MQPFSPLCAWPAGEHLYQAARLLHYVGARRLSAALRMRNYRQNKSSHRYFLQAQFVRLARGRALAVSRDIDARLRAAEDVPDDDRADFLALNGWIHGMWRDFEAAFPLLDEAIRLNPEDPWIAKITTRQ